VRWQVQQQWFSYTEKVDHMVEEAFRLNIKWSLQELSRAINGDGKSGANPFFKVQVILENEKVCPSVLRRSLMPLVVTLDSFLESNFRKSKVAQFPLHALFAWPCAKVYFIASNFNKIEHVIFCETL